MDLTQLLTVKDVAKLWAVTPRTIHRWISLGRLRPVRQGHTIRFKRDDLIRAMDTYQYGDPNPPHDPSMG